MLARRSTTDAPDTAETAGVEVVTGVEATNAAGRPFTGAPRIARGVSPAAGSSAQVHVADHALVVLSGTAVRTNDTHSAVAWYAEQLGRGLAAALNHSPGAELRELLFGQITVVRDSWRLLPRQSPAASVAIIRWDARRLDALVLGDTSVTVVTTAGGTGQLSDPRPAHAQRMCPVPDVLWRLRQGRGFDAYHQARITEQRAWLADHAVNVDQDGGYWLAETDPEAAYRAYIQSWPVDAIRLAGAWTTGLTSARTGYGLLTAARADHPQSVVDAVRAAEVNDPSGRRWPRAAAVSDHALALADFRPDAPT